MEPEILVTVSLRLPQADRGALGHAAEWRWSERHGGWLTVCEHHGDLGRFPGAWL